MALWLESWYKDTLHKARKGIVYKHCFECFLKMFRFFDRLARGLGVIFDRALTPPTFGRVWIYTKFCRHFLRAKLFIPQCFSARSNPVQVRRRGRAACTGAAQFACQRRIICRGISVVELSVEEAAPCTARQEEPFKCR